MKNTFKKVMASVVATVTLAVGMTAMSSNAYWTTKNIYNNIGNVVGTAYCSVSSTSIYATTESPYDVEVSVSIISINNANQNPYHTVTARGKKAEFYRTGSTYYQATTRHTVSGQGSTDIAMNA